MKKLSANHPDQPGSSPGNLGRFFFPVALWLLVICAGTALAGQPWAEKPVHTFSLVSGLAAKVQPDGSLLIGTGAGATPLLTTEILTLINNRRNRGRTEPPFTSVVAEGSVGGQRGFSNNCDDDHDGNVDEDPLDGVDNDGDGRIDEDFAAIGDAMVVVHQDARRGGDRAAHVEYYHWAYPHLRATVFLAAKGSPGLSNGGTYRLVLGSQNWQETSIVANRHNLAGKTESGRLTAFVAQPARPDQNGNPGSSHTCDPVARLWVGVVVLDESPGSRAVLDGGVLDLQLGEDPIAVAVCVAESWLQLNHMLNETTQVRAGVTDKVTGQQAPWIVPPLCVHCRLSAAPEFTWLIDANQDLQVTARISPKHNGALDPDLFRLAGAYLGAPREILWQPDDGPSVSVPWICMNENLLDQPHDRLTNPYAQMAGLLNHQGSGQLRFTFAAPEANLLSVSTEITGSYLNGRPFVASLTTVAVAESPASLGEVFVTEAQGAELRLDAVDQGQLLKSSSQRPTLSPQLLEGFPNPFRDVIRLRYLVPATMAEAFVWDKKEDPPAGLDLMAAVPWNGGEPSVSVKIYSINGQELVTLFSGSQAPGEGTVQWNGADSFGRRVAAGTYFCKLQMDNWSVTRRIVYLR
ncbi:MAG: FlgD immunoglobulin-like domain containing protein [Candidatus Krumholzibacteria bacterium]|nr:FlgD immunoglobulin-like domain containing protein [Candidatus Krumholzibacteria bacterium]